MKSITQDNHSTESFNTKMSLFFKEFHVGRFLRAANANKLKGFPVVQVFLLAVTILFQHRSLYMQMHLHQDSLPFAKDTFYRFMNSCRINWRRFTTLLSAYIIHETIEPLTASDRRNVFIIDDSLFSRARSKKVELLAKVYDHAHGVFTYGFRMLTLGWSDGNTFLPINHCLLSTANEKNRINEASKAIDARTNGGHQRRLSQQKATDVVLTLLKDALKAGIPAKHVLFDTWFCSPSSLIAIKKLGLEVVAMAKKTVKIHYLYNGKLQDVKAIYQQNKKRRGRSKYLLSVEATVEKEGEKLPVRLVFVRNRNKRKDYLVLVSTDLTLSEEEIIQLYGRRWSIEVFFKMCKTYLRLVKDCRSISYDAMTAHVAIVFTRYMMLAVEQRQNVDMRTIGELFYYGVDELPEMAYLDALHLILQQFAALIQKQILIDEKTIAKMLESFMQELPQMWQENLQKCA